MTAMQRTSYGRIQDKPLVLTEIGLPTPGKHEVLIRVSACAICHTDLHVIEGELPRVKLPIVPGHQVVGVIEKVGPNVTLHNVGERVGVAWLNATDGTCEYCIRRKENLCEHPRFTGYHLDGGYAEYVVSHDSFLYTLPPRLSDESAAPLLCAGIIGYRSLKLAGVQQGERLGIFGFGASAHIVLQLAKARGYEVYVFSRDKHHRQLARTLGADWTGTADEKPPKLLHGAISFAPVGALVPIALGKLQKGGILALAGIFMTPIPQFDYNLLYQERIIRSVANNTREDGVEFLKEAEAIPVKTEIEIFPLHQANEALIKLKEGKINGAGVLKIR
jgi:propanol-preferring alcohol dehydrogenase